MISYLYKDFGYSGEPYGKTITPELKRVPHPKWGAVSTRIEAKMNDELGLGSNKVELRRHRVRKFGIPQGQKMIYKKRDRDIQLNRQGERRLKRRRISA